MGAFHYAKDTGNFGRNSNEKVCFGFFQPEYLGSTLEVVHLLRLELAVPFLTNRFFALIREFRKGKISGKSHSYWLPLFHRKMLFHFPRVFPLISERLVGIMESTQYLRNRKQGSLGEREMLWKQKLTGECFHSSFEFS